MIKRRAHDVLTVVSFIRGHERKPTSIEVRAGALKYGDLPALLRRAAR